MANLSCDLCKGKLVIGTGGIATCESCGMEYTKDRMQEMLTENKNTVEVSNIAGIENLMKRGQTFLEDSNWKQAKIYFDKVLDLNPEYANAYIGKLCAELKLQNENKLKNVNIHIYNNINFQRAFRYSDIDNQKRLKNIEEIVKERLKKITQAQEWCGSDKVTLLCWHCGGKTKAGLFGNVYTSPCKICGKNNSECFLCGGTVNRDNKFSIGICTKCGTNFRDIGIS